MTELTLDEHALLRSTVAQAHSLTGLPVVFGGPVNPAGLMLSESAGMRTRSLHNLTVAPQRGLGGRSLQTRKPASVLHYESSSSISHHYDRQVTAEGLVSLVAIPVLVGQQVRAVLYGALREPHPIGDVAVDRLVAAAAQLGAALRAGRRQRRPGQRTAAVTAADLSGAELEEARRLFALLRAAARAQSDPDTRARITELGGRLLGAVADRPGVRALPGRSELTPREIDVLTLAALGTRNRDIAELLDVSGETVKSYLRNAMLKLGAHSRRAAVDRARLAGVIP